MKKISRARFLATASPILTLAGSARLAAQAGDTPIVIRDGSLKMRSAVKWADFEQETNRRRRHPNDGKRITSVVVEFPAGRNTIQFDRQRCEVKVTYSGTDVLLFTNSGGRNLKVETDWALFNPGAGAEDLEHSNPNSVISRVIVKREGTTVLDESPGGGTIVTLHYQD